MTVLKLLVANHHLVNYAGSELHTPVATRRHFVASRVRNFSGLALATKDHRFLEGQAISGGGADARGAIAPLTLSRCMRTWTTRCGTTGTAADDD